MQPKAAVINDFASFGRCSLAIALPILGLVLAILVFVLVRKLIRKLRNRKKAAPAEA